MVQDLLEMVSDAPVDHAGQWIPVRVRRGIHIWTSTVEGSPYCRIRGRMRCEATPAQLLQLLIDDERCDFVFGGMRQWLAGAHTNRTAAWSAIFSSCVFCVSRVVFALHMHVS